MCKMDTAKCSNLFQIVFLIIFIHFCAAAPVNLTENAYTEFVTELNRNKCSIPSEVHLPFDTTKAKDFDFFSSYLELCQKTESAKRNREAVVLCKEIFDNIRSISCPSHPSLPDISEDLSANVCRDIGVLKVPEDKSLLKRLTDVFLCDMMCDSEFEKACQVLLWSFKVQKRIASVASAQEPEQSSVPQNEGDLNGEDSFKHGNAVDKNVAPEISVNPENEDSFKHGNAVDKNVAPEISVNPENEKKNVEEAEGENKVVEQSGIAEVPKPRNLEYPGQNLILSEKEKPTPNDTGDVVGNQTIPNAKSQDPTVASSNIKLASTLLQPSPGVQTLNSDSEVTPVEEMTTGDSDGEIANKQFQGNKANNDKANAENELPQGSNVNAAIDEAGDVNTIPDETVQGRKGIDIHPQDNSSTNTAGNQMTDGTPVRGDQSSKSDVPAHELGNEKNPIDAASGLFKVQSNVTNDDKLRKKTDSLSATSEAIKGTTQLETEAQDKIGITKDKTTTDKLQTDSVSGTQNHTQTVTDVEISNPPTNQKTLRVVQPTDNTIVATDEKSQKLSSTATFPENLPETSTKTTVALEKMEGASDRHQPVDEEADHYGDQENTEDDEYSRSEPDYGAGLYEVSKNKDVPSPITSAKETGHNEKQFPPRNPFGQDIQMISSFPEQEDSHFFFYFLSIVLILMAGYLIFHNKQKIIALIVEGRHERNRRSHRIGYKKLETK